LDRVTDFVDIASFATDPGDGLWFRELTKWPNAPREIDVHDARRAFVFVLNWVLRWEAFEARRPPDPDWGGDDIDLDADAAPLQIATISHAPNKSWDREKIAFSVELADPPVGWSRFVSVAQHELRATDEYDGIGLAQADNRCGFWIVLDRELSTSAMRTRIDRVIAATQRALDNERSRLRKRRADLRAAEAHARDALSAAPQIACIAAVGASSDPDATPVAVTVASEVWDGNDTRAMAEALRQQAKAAGVDPGALTVHHGRPVIEIDVSTYPLASLPDLIERAAAEVRNARIVEEQQQYAQQRDVEALIAELNDDGT
jgi:hypothetical protein